MILLIRKIEAAHGREGNAKSYVQMAQEYEITELNGWLG